MPSKLTRRLRRGTLTSKAGNRDFYKGRGGRTEGVHTTKGAFTPLASRMMAIVAPSAEAMAACALRPYVHAKKAPPPRGARVPAWADADAGAATFLRGGAPPPTPQLK
jgi:hypothetical protein